MIGGAVVPQAMWAHTYPKHGQLIACRAVLRRSALQLVALAALTYFSGGIAAGIYGAAGGTYVAAAAGTWISAIQAGVFIAGSVLINKVLGPKIPSAQSLAQKQVYSLSDQRNTARPYEPIPVLWGEMRVTPDLASKAYAWYEGDDQYLSTILLGGINVHSVADLAIGDTPIGNYSDVSVYYNGFSGMPSQDVPLYSNVDAVAGAEFVNGGDWITRTGSAGAGVLQLDIEGQLYDVDGKGNIKPNWVDLTIEARLVGASAWTPLSSSTLTNSSTDVLRRTLSFDVVPGQYEVRAKLGVPRWNDGGSADACKFSWVSLKSVQADTTDYSQWGRIGIKIRASGQLSGSLDQVRATYRAKPMPIWTGTGWATATTRADGLSNPGAILLQTLRGVWATDSQGQRVLQFGFGLSDEQIDIEGLKAFMLHCAARGYTYDKWITPSMSLGAFCEEVALAGMGEFAWTDGSRPTAVFVTNGQPNSAVVNMANMLKGGFSVDYALSNAADGIEYQWLNRDTWEMTTLRVMAPGVTTMLSPARLTGEGITSEAHAAVMARYHLAQSLYQYKTVHYTADIEHLDYRRLSVLSVSHDLTQWGFGGRVMAAQRIGAQVQLTLDEPVPALASAYIGLRVPGARDYRVWPVQPLASESDVVTLVGEWPADLDFPGEGIGNPAHDTLWCYDFKATPGYRVRVTGIDPESDLKGARITAVPEGSEFWDYVLNGTYVPAPNQSSIPQLGRPVVKNLRVSEKVNLQGDTEWYELSCVWDVEGDCDHAQVWASRDGSELRLVDGNAQGARSTFRIDGAGEWLIVVRPFNANGQAGQSAEKLYITTMTQLPPRNPGTFVVQQVEGGLRRFAWMYAGERPAAFAGVQIRYLPDDVPLSVADWETMQPLGTADDVYAAQFVTTKPDAGQWTFGLRAVDTAGQLANGVMRVVAVLDTVFDNLVSPDLTPPPAPTGLDVSTSLANIHLGWDQPTYTVGHGPQFTRVYAVQLTTEAPAPDRAQAEIAAEIIGPVGSIARALGTTWRLWFVNVSNDGVESVDAGPVDVTVGKIGSTDLGPLIVEAGNLANGAVSANKLAAQAVDATKFANGIEPVTIITGTTLPTTKSTSNITFQGQLYTWNAATGKYETAKFDGSIGGANFLKNAALIPDTAGNPTAWAVYNNGGETNPATLTLQPGRYANRRWAKVVNHVVGAGTLGIYQTPTPYLQTYRAGQKYVLSFRAKTTTPADLNAVFLGWNHFPTTMTWLTPTALIAVETLYRVELVFAVDTQAELYISASPVGVMSQNAEVWITEPQLEEGDAATAWAPNPADILPGSITAVEIADNSITAPKLIAEAVTAGKIAANAVSAYNLQALAVTAGKIAADAVTAGTIAAGAISAREIAAGAVTTDKLVVTGRGTALNPDPQLEDVAHSWTIEGPGVTVSYGTGGSATSSRFFWTPGAAAGNSKVWSTDVLIDPSRTYRLTASLYTDFGNNRDMYIFVQFYDQTGAAIPHNGWGGYLSGYVFGGVPPADWSRQGGQFGAGVAGRPIPANARSAKIGVWFQYTGPGGTSSVAQAAADIRLELAQDASLIVDGAIVATKLAANSIAVGTAAIQDGAIVNAMIGNLSADKINAGTLNAARIAAGTISSSHLAANSVIAGKIAANAVTAGTIAANAVTANQIAAGAITVDKLAAGSISAEKLSIGIGGNLCPDPMFTPGLAFWSYAYSHSQYANCARGVNMNFDYTVPGTPTLFLGDITLYGQGQPLGTYRKGFTSAPISVMPGERYEASIYAGFHRCQGEVYFEYFDANDAWVGGGGFGIISDQPSAGRLLSNFRRTGGFTTAPAGAVTARLTIFASAQMSGTSYSNYMFLARPFVGRASALQTELSPWSPNSNTSILPDGITTPSISALAGKFGDIEIRPTAGASGCIRVYDSNGALRVRLGVW
ncbi:host specificity factor TipJ family phage tail protein [Comamonas thiooxydans]|uniref:host specificity factor TipJ family phage tail protein n=1 Tax=Comamonas thiooxydans TaxID=363952 RepID=UPI00244AF2BC|nr:host specificity factor TipJ family phage tail protein [Comamonas thiooxydans]MDH1255636.1 host specificity factor TipJ family phage tail protein [Comamonas thiooxydans]